MNNITTLFKQLNNLNNNNNFNNFKEKEIEREIEKGTTFDLDPLLDPMQKQAVINILTNRLSILTGAAGTGKTFTVKSILKNLIKDYPTSNIFITAFTGKAVLNLVKTFQTEEQVRPFASQSMTIHKFLEFKPHFEDKVSHTGIVTKSRTFKPTYNSENKRQDGKVIIIDEVSMVDKVLMSQLVVALDTGTLDKLILVGDINQLQPVIGTTSLADFSAHSKCSINTLTKIHRQKDGNDIVLIADMIKKADLVKLKKVIKYNTIDGEEPSEELVDITDPITNEVIKQPSNKLKNVRFIKADDYIDLYKCIDIIVTKKNFNFKDSLDVVVTQTNVGATGQEILNQRLNKYLKTDKHLVLCGVSNKLIGVGDNILFSKNNYKDGYINGTFGKVLSIELNEESDLSKRQQLIDDPTVKQSDKLNHMLSNFKNKSDAKDLENLLEEDEEMIAAINKAETEDGYMATAASHSIRIGFTSIYGSYNEITLSSIGDISNILLANAITCYKAQGSTYRNVIVNLVDNKSGNCINNEYAYTALTRSSNMAYIIYNEKGINKIKSRQLNGVTDLEKIQLLVKEEPNPVVTNFIDEWIN